MKAVYIFLNGMVCVFDEKGEQTPDLQGPWIDKKHAILDASNDSTRFYFASYMGWSQEIGRDVARRLNIDVAS